MFGVDVLQRRRLNTDADNFENGELCYTREGGGGVASKVRGVDKTGNLAK